MIKQSHFMFRRYDGHKTFVSILHEYSSDEPRKDDFKEVYTVLKKELHKIGYRLDEYNKEETDFWGLNE